MKDFFKWIGATSLAALVALILAGGLSEVAAQDSEPIRVAFTWDEPSCGAPAHHYLLQIEKNGIGAEPGDPVFSLADTLTFIIGNKYRVRVVAVDVDDRQSEWSGWSGYFSPALSPPGH